MGRTGRSLRASAGQTPDAAPGGAASILSLPDVAAVGRHPAHASGGAVHPLLNAMSPFLQSVADSFTEAQNRLHALLDAVDDDTFNQKPSAKGWSAAECVVHLNKIAKGYLPVMEEAVGRGGPRGEGPYTWGFVARRFVDAVRPGSRPIPTAGAMKPPAVTGLRSDIDRERVVARFDADVERWLALCESCGDLDLSQIKIRSPFLPLMKLPLGAFLEAMGVHAVRHVGQAERAAGVASSASAAVEGGVA